MWNAVIVDRDYGSVSLENQNYIKKQYLQNEISLRLEHYNTPEEIINGCQDADAILGTGNPPITKEVLENLLKLKVVQRFGIGVNSIDLEAATKRGVIVQFMPGFCVKELSVHAAALILNLLRNVGFYDRGIRKGEWRKATGYVPRNPEEMTLGLFGFGASGKLLYQIFKQGLGSKVIVCDPFIDKSIEKSMDVTVVSFGELLKNSDIISIHAPLTPETKHIFDYKAFEQMKNTSMIVNVSRGGLINQQDLEKALTDGEIRYAGLDVFEKEPLSLNSSLIDNENVALTCHSAFYGEHAQKNQIQLAIQLVDLVLNKKNVKKKYVANKDILNKLGNLKIIE